MWGDQSHGVKWGTEMMIDIYGRPYEQITWEETKKMNRSLFKRVESEISRYHQSIQDMQRLQEVAGEEDPNLSELKTITSVIRENYNRLPDIKRKLVYMRYWRRKKINFEQLALELHVGRRTAIRYRDEFVSRITKELQERLGWN